MARPRFERLKKEKRERILRAAAQAFAVSGFEQASMNQILDQAGISKGAAYYYFDNKADLYISTIQHYLAGMAETIDFSLDDIEAGNYWERIESFYTDQFLGTYEQPWVMGVIKSVLHAPAEILSSPLLSGYVAYFMDGIDMILQKGQALGLVRTDLPQSLLVSLFRAVDEAADDWFLARRDEIDPSQIEPTALQIFDTLKRVIEK
jgi:AcrR family transcriptional regulator